MRSTGINFSLPRTHGVHWMHRDGNVFMVRFSHARGVWLLFDESGPAPAGHPYTTRRAAETAMKRARLALLAETSSLFAAPEMLKGKRKHRRKIKKVKQVSAKALDPDPYEIQNWIISAPYYRIYPNIYSIA